VGLGWSLVMVLGLEVKVLTIVVMVPLLVVDGADAGVGAGVELLYLWLDLWLVRDGGCKDMHTGLPCVEGCALRMQQYEDVVTQLVA
jgi:hypothetical protein